MHRRFALVLFTLLAFVACKDDGASTAPTATPTATEKAVGSSEPVVPALAPATSAADSASRRAPPFLWKLSKGEQSGHLFGTVHIGVDPNKALNPIVWKRFAAAKAYIMEADPGSLNPLKIAKLSMLPADKSLAKLMGADNYKLLVGKLGVSMMGVPLERFKPWFITVALTQKLVPPTTPMDLVFHGKAQANKKKLAYLETMDEQIAMLDKAVTAEQLSDMLKDWSKATRLLKEIMSGYLKGDDKALAKAVFDPEEMKKYPEMYDLTFYKRNSA